MDIRKKYDFKKQSLYIYIWKNGYMLLEVQHLIAHKHPFS